MHLREWAPFAIAGVVALALVVREIARHLLVRYEYRWDSFSILGPFGRQLFQIRQSEIESLKRVGLGERFADRATARYWPRSHFGARVVIRAHMTRRPVVITWEGQPIAGLTPQGLKPRPPRDR